MKALIPHLLTVPESHRDHRSSCLRQDALFVGFVLPGETAVILGGVSAKLGEVPLAGVVATVMVAATTSFAPLKRASTAVDRGSWPLGLNEAELQRSQKDYELGDRARPSPSPECVDGLGPWSRWSSSIVASRSASSLATTRRVAGLGSRTA